MKMCSGCHEYHDESAFSKRGDSDKPRSKCKVCRAMEWAESQAAFRKEHPEEAKRKDREYKDANREKIRERAHAAYLADPERFRAKANRSYAKQAEKHRAYALVYHAAHKGEFNEYIKKRYREDPYYNTRARLAARISSAVRRGRKAARTEALIGCSIAAFVKHLESHFEAAGPHPATGETMSWENRRLWHIDHHIPCRAYEHLATDATEQRACFNYANLVPLWREDNLKKGSKIPGYKRLRKKSS